VERGKTGESILDIGDITGMPSTEGGEKLGTGSIQGMPTEEVGRNAINTARTSVNKLMSSIPKDHPLYGSIENWNNEVNTPDSDNKLLYKQKEGGRKELKVHPSSQKTVNGIENQLQSVISKREENARKKGKDDVIPSIQKINDPDFLKNVSAQIYHNFNIEDAEKKSPQLPNESKGKWISRVFKGYVNRIINNVVADELNPLRSTINPSYRPFVEFFNNNEIKQLLNEGNTDEVLKRYEQRKIHNGPMPIRGKK